MVRPLRERSRSDGITELDLNLDGVRVITVSVPTIVRYTLGSDALDDIVGLVTRNGGLVPEQFREAVDPS